MIARLRTMAGRVLRLAGRRLHPHRALVAAEFDRAFYLASSPDVARSGADPLDHFLTHGWREGRDPSPGFSVKQYLAANPDVADAGLNPFVHFLTTGRSEGRSTASDLGFRYDLLAAQRPLETEVAEIAARASAADPAPLERLAQALAEARFGLAGLHLTFSHDDYATNLGGVQLCLQREGERLQAIGRDHLNLHPPVPWPVLRNAGEPGLLSVRLNGRLVGAFQPADIARALAGARPGAETSFAIHSLLGHQVDETIAIVRAAGGEAGFFWLHDFASLCAGYTLLRNGVEDCGAPPPESMACGICRYGGRRRDHLAAHEALFAALKITVVGPAQTTLGFWRGRWKSPPATLVHPHAELKPRRPAAPASAGPLRVAFVGHPAAHKGWETFRALTDRFRDDPRYAFHHFGGHPGAGSGVAFEAVRVSAATPTAMQDALERRGVDIVIAWALCRETFSFAAHEAVAAGCAIVTGPDSGNVAALVQSGGFGRVLPDEAALAALFESGEALELGRARRAPMIYDLKLSGMTADLLPARVPA